MYWGQTLLLWGMYRGQTLQVRGMYRGQTGILHWWNITYDMECTGDRQEYHTDKTKSSWNSLKWRELISFVSIQTLLPLRRMSGGALFSSFYNFVCSSCYCIASACRTHQNNEYWVKLITHLWSCHLIKQHKVGSIIPTILG